MKYRHLLLLFLLTINQLGIVSAKTNDTIGTKNLQIEFRASYGFMICHHQEMKIFQSHFPLFELSVQQATFGNKYWQTKTNYPAVGLTFLYSGLGSMPEIGKAYALYPYMSFNFLKSRRHQLNLRLGIGLSYVTNPYDAKSNPKNTFNGSHLNATLSASFEYNFFITNRLSLSLFAGLTHFSNGGSRAPNNGMNIGHGGITAKCFIAPPKARIPAQRIDNQQYKPWIWDNLSLYFAFTYSVKDLDEYMGYNMRWSVYNVQIHTLKRITEMSRLGLGFDIVYDMSDKDVLKIKGIEFTDIQILKPGVNVAYELSLDNTSFLFNFGVHIAGKEMGEGRLYQKLGIKQNLTRHIFATITLTTHFGWADYVGFGLGYKLH